MTPQEWEFLLNEMEAALRELWEALTPQQRQVVEEFFLRVWAAIRDARAAGAAAAATSAQQIGAAMRGLIYRLARMGAQGPLNTLLVRVVGILGQWTTMFGGGSAAVGGTATAGGTAATGGTATAGGTAAAAGGTAAAATVAAALFAVAAVITAAISIYSEATTELELPSGGTPCGSVITRLKMARNRQNSAAIAANRAAVDREGVGVEHNVAA